MARSAMAVTPELIFRCRICLLNCVFRKRMKKKQCRWLGEKLILTVVFSASVDVCAEVNLVKIHMKTTTTRSALEMAAIAGTS